MGVKVNYDELCNEVGSTNTRLNCYAETAENCINELKTYCEESGLSGEAYANSKKFFSETYIPIMEQIKEICGSMVEENNKILTEFQRIVPTTFGFAADTDVLEAEIQRLENCNTCYQEQIDSYPVDERNIITGGMCIYWELCISYNNYFINKYEEIIENLQEFDSSYTSIFNNNNISRIEEIDAAISSLGEAFTSDAARFTIPESVISLKLKNKDDSLNYEEFIKLINKGDDMTEEEFRAIWGLVFPSRKKCPQQITLDKLKKEAIEHLTNSVYDEVKKYQKDILVVLYELDHSEHAEAMDTFFNDIPEDTEDHKYTDDVRNIKFFAYTAYEPYRSIYLSFIGDIEVADWELNDTTQNYTPGQGLNLDLTDSRDSKGKFIGDGEHDPKGPYVAFFHECFHAIDDAMAADINGKTTWATVQNDLYDKAEEDVKDKILDEIEKLDPNGELSDSHELILNKIMGSDNSGFPSNTPEAEIYKEVTENIAAEIGRTNHNKTDGISDVIEGYTNNSINTYAGHYDRHPDYWYDEAGNTTYNQPRELWASYFSRVMTRDTVATDAIEKYFPKATDEMQKMVKNYGGN